MFHSTTILCHILIEVTEGISALTPLLLTALWTALTMRLFHCNVVCGGGSPEALTFSSTGPCTWLLFSALCTVQVDIVLPLQVHDEGSCPPSWRCYRALWLLIANAAMRSCAWELESSKVKWYAWLTGVCLCCGTQTISL